MPSVFPLALVRAVLVILRVWGMHRALLFALVLAASAQVFASQTMRLPTLESFVAFVSLIPPAGAVFLGNSLLEPMPQQCLVAVRNLRGLYACRYVAMQCAGVPVAIVLSIAVGSYLTAAAPGFLGLAAICVTVLGRWYWVPLIAVMWGWLHFSQTDSYVDFVDVGWAGMVGLILIPGVIYAACVPRAAAL